MERRDFLKTSLLMSCSLCSFSGNSVSFAGNGHRSMFDADAKYSAFTGDFTASLLKNHFVIMPDSFSKRLLSETFMVFVPEKNSSIILIPEKSQEWIALKQLFDAANTEGTHILCEQAEIDGEGNLHLSDSVRMYSGIQSPTVSVIGRRYVIEIMDQRHQDSPFV